MYAVHVSMVNEAHSHFGMKKHLNFNFSVLIECFFLNSGSEISF